jgi:hypothetical protein
MNTNPFMNNCLIEVIREDDGVSRTDDNETRNRGKIVELSVSRYHLTASAGFEISTSYIDTIISILEPGVIVRWEEFAEGGQTFEENGKTYALIPWWRIISVEKETK